MGLKLQLELESLEIINAQGIIKEETTAETVAVMTVEEIAEMAAETVAVMTVEAIAEMAAEATAENEMTEEVEITQTIVIGNAQSVVIPILRSGPNAIDVASLKEEVGVTTHNVNKGQGKKHIPTTTGLAGSVKTPTFHSEMNAIVAEPPKVEVEIEALQRNGKAMIEGLVTEMNLSQGQVIGTVHNVANRILQNEMIALDVDALSA